MGHVFLVRGGAFFSGWRRRQGTRTWLRREWAWSFCGLAGFTPLSFPVPVFTPSLLLADGVAPPVSSGYV